MLTCVTSTATAHGIIYEYQTLIAGLLAVGAALLTVRIGSRQLSAAEAQVTVVREQINAAKAEADRDRHGKLRAARASMPTILSAVCAYAVACGKTMSAAWPIERQLYPDEPNARSVIKVQFILPPFPPGLTSPLERIVELTDVDLVARRIESILRSIQLLEARTSEYIDPTSVFPNELASHIVDAALIYARASSLFGYARQEFGSVVPEDVNEYIAPALSALGARLPMVDKQLSWRMEHNLLRD